MYCQCRLERKGIDGIEVLVSYISAKYAKVGITLKLMQTNGGWQDGWTVTRTGAVKEIVDDIKMSIRKHRKNTGDSLPK